MNRFSPALGLAAAGLLLGAPARAATIIYSNDVMGELEPCGCRHNPEGGVVRKDELLRRYKKDEDASVLQLDAGNLLFESEELVDSLKHQAKAQAGYLVRAYNDLGTDAVVPGPKDFALGLPTFLELKKKAHFKFLAANLVQKSDKKPLLGTHSVFKLKDAKGKPYTVGVFGLVGKDLRWPSGLVAENPVSAAKREVAALKKENVDLIVALTHEGLDQDKTLAEAVDGIGVIVGGESQSFLQHPEQVKKTLIFQSSFRNQYVGILPLTPSIDLEKHRLVSLDAGYEPEKPTPMAKLVAEFKEAIARINTEEAQKEEKRAAKAAAKAPAGPRFQTFPKCAECHLTQFDFWRKTFHADALEPLMKSSQIRNKDCLR
ncbi:MAG TPA: hypothetical protein VL588_07300, partial [Bdellovibrionota bacterium]|nr:hypothetical protein [Bdellovibrionota bacterium]